MNGNLYQNPTFPGADDNYSEVISDKLLDITDVKSSQSNTFSLSNLIGKKIKIYVSYPNDSSWNNKVYSGTLFQLDNDYIIIKDIKDNLYTIIKNKYIDFAEFENYEK